MSDDKDGIHFTTDDCRRWAEEMDANLDKIRAEQGEDAYRKYCAACFLFQAFAETLDSGAADDVVVKDEELN